MNEFIARSEPVSSDRAINRPVSPVQAVQPATARAPTSERDSAGDPNGAPAPSMAAGLADDDLASAAQYASVHLRIANILADLRAGGGQMGIDDAAESIQQMMPAPIVLVPLPPASREAVEHAARLAKRMADNAMLAHSAQAHVRRGTVDQLLSSQG